MRLLRKIALALACIAVSPGCLRHATEELRASPRQPLMTYENASPRFSVKVYANAPGNMRFHVQNLLRDFTLAGLPEIASPTGRIMQPRLLGKEAIEFNLLLPGDAYRRSPNDVTIPWVLIE